MINEFKGEYFFLSNFYVADITYKGATYTNNEAAFQAQKCANEKDKIKFETLNPIDARNLGRNILMRKDWESIKDIEMANICKAKFEQHPELMKKLLYTGNRPLEEGNHWNDVYWGTVRGKGKNKLGKILMTIRKNEREKGKEYDR